MHKPESVRENEMHKVPVNSVIPNPAKRPWAQLKCQTVLFDL